MTADQALSFLDEMKRRGVRSFKFGELSVDFAPAEPPPLKEAKRVEADVCQCGHGFHAHQSGLCLAGCEPEKCLPEGTT